MTRFLCLLLLTVSFLPCAQAQNTRGIIPIEFARARPAKGQTPTNRRTVYRRTSAQSVAASKADEFSQLGLTIWRLRPATATDPNVRIIVQKETESVELIPERVPANAPLRIGENIRFSFESPQAGYLYVIDRELYADGSLSEPLLIFPTTRTRKGDNKVEAGKLIEIPAQEDRPNYFTLQVSRLNNLSQTGEVLTVIVAPKPLEGISIGATALSLTNEQLRQWEQQWGARSETFDLAGGAGKTWTKAEQEAGASGARYLTQEDPEPQTIYRVAVKPGATLLVKIGLRYSKTSTVSRNRPTLR
ncbi:MAG: DUF4384 domain-containing protein [Blastocatellia bacterium]